MTINSKPTVLKLVSGLAIAVGLAAPVRTAHADVGAVVGCFLCPICCVGASVVKVLQNPSKENLTNLVETVGLSPPVFEGAKVVNKVIADDPMLDKMLKGIETPTIGTSPPSVPLPAPTPIGPPVTQPVVPLPGPTPIGPPVTQPVVTPETTAPPATT